jgi:hypothetical protein
LSGATWNACAFSSVATTCRASRATPSSPIGLIATTLLPYDADSRNRPVASVEIQHMLAGSGALPIGESRPLAGSIARLRTRSGSERIDA